MLFKYGRGLANDSLVAVCSRLGHLHDPPIHLKPAHLLHGIQSGLLAVEHDKRLTLALQALLHYDVENRAIVLEDGGQGSFHGLHLDALFKIVDL